MLYTNIHTYNTNINIITVLCTVYCLLVWYSLIFDSYRTSQVVYRNLWYIKSPMRKAICLLLGWFVISAKAAKKINILTTQYKRIPNEQGVDTMEQNKIVCYLQYSMYLEQNEAKLIPVTSEMKKRKKNFIWNLFNILRKDLRSQEPISSKDKELKWRVSGSCLVSLSVWRMKNQTYFGDRP